MYKYISLEGNIGAGKTTLAKALSKELGANLILEEFAENPFLPRFYENPDKHAFALEMSFLAARFNQLKSVQSTNLFNEHTVSDYVFFKSLIFASITLSPDESVLYKSLFNIIYQKLTPPDILIFLYTPVEQLLENIKIRGRAYEQNIKREYLEKLHETYFDFFGQIKEYPIVVIHTEKVKFAEVDLLKDILKNKFENGMNIITE
jgi:deoxyguanosine kinase